MNEVPPGWYPDQDGSGWFHFWDGRAWVGGPRSKEQLDAELQAASKPIDSLREPVLPVPTPQRRERSKIPLFGARKAAEGLSEEVDILREAVARFGIEDDVEREFRRAALEREISDEEASLRVLQVDRLRVSRELHEAQAGIVDLRSVADLQAVGLYDYEHPAESSTLFAGQLEKVQAEIKTTIKSRRATTATTNFTFNNSLKQGTKFVSDMSNLLLRAYNAEAENCVKGAKAGNLEANTKRLNLVVDQIARQGSMINLRITPQYHQLRLAEIGLATKHLVSLAREKESERERREELREQRKAELEYLREKERLDKEKSRILSAIDTLRANDDLEGVTRLQGDLAEVDDAIAGVTERQANIRAGHVYVISNIGAFGREMVKIGMTRRLEPMDRIRELGDASVPFRFDVHALFYAKDAVGVETMLHRAFEDRKVNKINPHREFFRVLPDEVLAELKKHQVAEVLEFTLDPEAVEYRASIGDLPISTVHSTDEALADDPLEDEREEIDVT